MAEPENSKPPGLRAQAKAEVNRRIRAAANDLLAERDYSEVTTSEIAKHAGIGEATLFRYVSSKSELLTMIYGEQMQKLVDRLEIADDELARRPVTAALVRERIHRLYIGRCQFYLLHPDNAARYLRQANDPSSPGRLHAMQQGDRLIRRATEILEIGQREGIIGDLIEAPLIALNFHGAFLQEVNRTRTRGFDPETIWDRVSVRIDAQLLPLMAYEEAVRLKSQQVGQPREMPALI